MFTLTITTAIAIFSYMVFMYLMSRIVKDNSIVDLSWGPGFLVVVIVLLLQAGQVSLNQWIYSILILLWSTRLAVYIGLRRRGHGEDFRYANWRREWGKKEPLIAFFKVFMLQGAVMFIMSWLSILIFNGGKNEIGILEIAGMLIFILGFLMESIADAQMSAFKRFPESKGKLMTTGLWSISRHPNYAGEAILWWGLFLMAIPVHLGWTGLIVPVLITWLLRYVSGVPMLEEKYKNHPDWEEYAMKTPVFIPWFRK